MFNPEPSFWLLWFTNTLCSSSKLTRVFPRCAWQKSHRGKDRISWSIGRNFRTCLYISCPHDAATTSICLKWKQPCKQQGWTVKVPWFKPPPTSCFCGLTYVNDDKKKFKKKQSCTSGSSFLVPAPMTFFLSSKFRSTVHIPWWFDLDRWHSSDPVAGWKILTLVNKGISGKTRKMREIFRLHNIDAAICVHPTDSKCACFLFWTSFV